MTDKKPAITYAGMADFLYALALSIHTLERFDGPIPQSLIRMTLMRNINDRLPQHERDPSSPNTTEPSELKILHDTFMQFLIELELRNPK